MKLPNGVTQEFADSITAMSTEDLQAAVVRLQMQNQENEDFKESPEYLAEKEIFLAAKERFSLIATPVKEVTVSIRNRTKMVVERLKEKGKG